MQILDCFAVPVFNLQFNNGLRIFTVKRLYANMCKNSAKHGKHVKNLRMVIL